MEDRNNRKTEHLIWALGGLAVGSIFTKSAADEAKKSRAEKESPEDAREVCEEIGELLEEWEADEDCETEEDFTQCLAAYLVENSDWEIEVYPGTPEGKPDILVGDLLALELKVDPSKGERDRLVGQCAGYSRLWVTWAVVIGAKGSKVGRLIELLKDKGLDHIAVWRF